MQSFWVALNGTAPETGVRPNPGTESDVRKLRPKVTSEWIQPRVIQWVMTPVFPVQPQGAGLWLIA